MGFEGYFYLIIFLSLFVLSPFKYCPYLLFLLTIDSQSDYLESDCERIFIDRELLFIGYL
jgi:hypothetical protein